MKTAATFLTQAQKEAVERAIAEAETRTSAELVVVVATRSGRYDRAEDLFGLVLALVAVAIAWVLWQDIGPSTRDWSSGQTLTFGLAPLLLMFALWAFVGAMLATWVPALARPFIPRAQIEAEVRRRGFEAFHLYRVGHTTSRDGVLIFISLLEHTALVVGDEAVNPRMPASTWQSACAAITSGTKRGEPDRGLIDAIRQCGDALAGPFPVRPDDANTLPNTLHVMD